MWFAVWSLNFLRDCAFCFLFSDSSENWTFFFGLFAMLVLAPQTSFVFSKKKTQVKLERFHVDRTNWSQFGGKFFFFLLECCEKILLWMKLWSQVYVQFVQKKKLKKVIVGSLSITILKYSWFEIPSSIQFIVKLKAIFIELLLGALIARDI